MCQSAGGGSWVGSAGDRWWSRSSDREVCFCTHVFMELLLKYIMFSISNLKIKSGMLGSPSSDSWKRRYDISVGGVTDHPPNPAFTSPPGGKQRETSAPIISCVLHEKLSGCCGHRSSTPDKSWIFHNLANGALLHLTSLVAFTAAKTMSSVSSGKKNKLFGCH